MGPGPGPGLEPYAGTIDHVWMDGRSLDAELDLVQLDGRPVATLVVLLSNRDNVVISWTMRPARTRSTTWSSGDPQHRSGQ